MKLSKKHLFLPLVVLFFGLLFSVVATTLLKKPLLTQNRASSQKSAAVLGSRYRSPQLYISDAKNGYAAGGMIALASTDEAAVTVGGYNVAGTVDVTLYEANEAALYSYLLHDKNGKQIQGKPNINTFRYVTTLKQTFSSGSSSGNGTKVVLPLSEKGIWYLKMQLGEVSADAFILRSPVGVLAKEGDNEFIFWSQNYNTKRSVTDGTIKVYNMQDGKKELHSVSVDSDGIAKAPISADADIAVLEQGDNRAIVPVNLKYLNYGSSSYKQFQPKQKETKYFTFTDRPIYKPGDTIYFKSILRDDDDARYTIPQGTAVLKVRKGYDDKDNVFEKSIAISPDGTIQGQYTLPQTAEVGYYTVSVSLPGVEGSSTSYFDVQYYQKPEFFLNVSVPQQEVIAGEKASFTIKGEYFSGQALANQKVRYEVDRSETYEYEYYLEYQFDADYGYYYGESVTKGTVTLNRKGEAVVEIPTKTPNKGKSQIFSIRVTLDDGSQTPAFTTKNVLVYSGEYAIYRKNTTYFYSSKVNTPLELPLILKSYVQDKNLNGITLSARVKRETWIPYSDPKEKYPQWKKEEETLLPLSARTDSKGETTFSFTPTKTGSYTFSIEGKDSKGNTIAKTFYAYVTAEDAPSYDVDGNNDLTIGADKKEYKPTDTARLTIYSTIPDRDVFLSFDRLRVNRFQVVHMQGRNATVEIPFVTTDMPNMYATVTSFSDTSLESNEVNLVVSAESKDLQVKVTPNSKKFGPGETITVNIETTDSAGNPVSSDVALWTVDKAIYELASSNLGNIFETFWDQRYNDTSQAHSLEGITVNMAEKGGGCFAKGTLVLMADGTHKSIEDVRAGEYILTRGESDAKQYSAKVVGTHSATVDGYLILNGTLKVTANHILWVNNAWKEAGSVQLGDLLVDEKGQGKHVESIEWQAGKFTVYNLEIDTYHTYFAGGMWVHNQKGEARALFKDTAYWNPSVHTDASGRAKVTFTLPDNLTTWTIAAVGSSIDTKVGQTHTDVVVTKDIIVRPILPNILRVGDEVYLSALVQNFTNTDDVFDVEAKFDSGTVDTALRTGVKVKANDMQQLYWKMSPKTQKEKAKVTFSAISKTNKNAADVITQEIPVRAFGFEERKADTGEGNKTFNVILAADSDKQKASVQLSLASTLTGTLPTAMEYLIAYPYGCVEQTTSRFVPAVIAKSNPDLFADALKDKNIDDILQKSIARLTLLQQSDGGWTWWYSGKSDPFVTAYVVEYLLEAKKVGMPVDKLLGRAKNYLSYENTLDGEYEKVARAYGLSLLGEQKTLTMTKASGYTPDVLALAIMTNYRNGNKDPHTNGVDMLALMAHAQGDGVFWDKGTSIYFGSEDASTALVIRALLMAEGDRNLAAKGIRFLTRNRKFDYWSNTFATAQVIRTVVDFAKTGNELTPNYTYTVSLDGKPIANGSVTSAKQVLKDIEVPTKDIQANGSQLSVSYKGDGQLYSTLVIHDFRTDKKAKAHNHGLLVKRKYVNEKGEKYTLAVGDTVKVMITVSGLRSTELYGVIEDSLPAGMVPINTRLKNEQYGDTRDTYNFDVMDTETTENGMVLSLYELSSDEKTYTYRARVVSEGTFAVPPVVASLMYAPEIFGRSEAQTITIAKESSVVPGYEILQSLRESALPLIAFITIVLGAFIALTVYRKHKAKNATVSSEPPTVQK